MTSVSPEAGLSLPALRPSSHSTIPQFPRQAVSRVHSTTLNAQPRKKLLFNRPPWSPFGPNNTEVATALAEAAASPPAGTGGESCDGKAADERRSLQISPQDKLSGDVGTRDALEPQNSKLANIRESTNRLAPIETGKPLATGQTGNSCEIPETRLRITIAFSWLSEVGNTLSRFMSGRVPHLQSLGLHFRQGHRQTGRALWASIYVHAPITMAFRGRLNNVKTARMQIQYYEKIEEFIEG